jgi:uncharacterized protein YjbI with pentapeptide repeats
LAGANVPRSDLTSARLNGANLRKANLRDARLNGADLTSARLNGADLTSATLTRADLDGQQQLDEGLVTRTVARIRLTGKMAHDHLVRPPPVSP